MTLTFAMVRAGLEQLDKIRQELYPNGPDGELVYRSYLVGQIYLAMKAVADADDNQDSEITLR